MMDRGSRARALWLGSVVVAGAVLAGCGGSDSSSASQTNSITQIDRVPSSPGAKPTIQGTAATTAVAGQPYTFQPVVSTSGSTNLSFTIANLPAWAQFNATTGVLSGTPTAQQIGQYPGVAITLNDNGQTVSLPPFTIVVANATSSADNVTLSWQPPTENADGSALVNLQGYEIHYGPQPNTYNETIKVANPGLTTYVVQNLAAGTYYFAITAYNSVGSESSLSPEVSAMVD
ncbi:MAG TPA: putative Ig domain-containing protein [Steroidobacteraceae bacterium]